MKLLKVLLGFTQWFIITLKLTEAVLHVSDLPAGRIDQWPRTIHMDLNEDHRQSI